MTSRLDPQTAPLDGINLIEASAGTGKTWNICALYLRLLLERKLPVKEILVVTFTIAATAELRERVRARISEALAYVKGDVKAETQTPAIGPAADDFIPKLIDRLIAQPDRTRKELADLLDLALQSFDEASIFTIHGFCQRALGDSAFAAGLPFDTEIATDDNAIVIEAVTDFWRRHIASDEFPPALASYMASMKDTKRDKPETLARFITRHVAKPLARSIWPDGLDEAAVAVDFDALQTAFASARVAWQNDRQAVIDCINNGIGSLNKGSYSGKSIDQAAVEWDQYFLGLDPIAQPGGKKTPVSNKHLLLSAAILKHRTNKTGAGITPHHSVCAQLEDLLKLHASTREAVTLARLRLIRAMIEEVAQDLPRRKRERRVIAFNDMLSNLHEALHDQRYPWLAAELRQRFPAALIDEFQDTDPLQFAIFDAIYGNANATEATLFMVGDPKQAIYSFRNADLYTYLHAREKAAAQFTLDRNQRSTPGLITAVNGLFGANARAFMLDGLDYQKFEPGQRERKPLNDRSETKVGSDLCVWMLPQEAPLHRSEVREVAVQATAAEIARLLGESKAGRIDIGGAPLRASDIAILVRSHAQGSELKRALARLNVGSVELRQESVFSSLDADEVQRLLMAITEPSRLGLLRAALATEMLGHDAIQIAALSADESALQRRIEQFSAWRDLWMRSGAGVMFRQLLTDENVSARMLRRSDGERRLTNLLHLGEELHKAAQVHDSPEALVRWFGTMRRDQSAADATQLRLESDQNLVQIATIHKAKGLEYPIVFCPFLWDGYLMPRRSFVEGREYHQASALAADAVGGTGGAGGTAVIDYRSFDKKDPVDEAIKAQIKLEDSAETLRLAYVALTRAVYRCYLIAGTYVSKRGVESSTAQSCDSLLNWLVAGNGVTPESWWASERLPQHIAAAWTTMAAGCDPHVGLMPLPMTEGQPLTIDQPSAASLVALAPPAHIASAWRISSFSGLANSAISEAANRTAHKTASETANESAAIDHDARTGTGVGAGDAAVRRPGLPPPEIAPDDILRFPRGTNAGDCLHAVFERIDFADASTWKEAIAYALAAHPQSNARSVGSGAATSRAALTAMIERTLVDVTSTELLPGLRLSDVQLNRRLTELEFSVPAGDLSPSSLNRWLADAGYLVPRLAYGNLEGYLKGFIDLVFEHDGRYWILDWKSNHLGWTTADYGSDSIGAAMVEHAYHLQHLIYTIALHRYLSHRMKDYRYERHFGGVLYAFVRGVRPQWKNADGTQAGVFHHRPDVATIEWLDRALRGEHRRRA